MAQNPYVNKVVYGNQTIFDVTSDTVAPNNVLKGYTAVANSGELIEGTVESSLAVAIGNKLVIPTSIATLSGKNLIFN